MRKLLFGCLIIVAFCVLLVFGFWVIAKFDQMETSSPAQAPPPKAAGVTMAKFLQIRDGMTYEEVVKIIGAPGQLQSSSDMVGIKTVMYGWQNPDGANMNAMFQNGALVSKAQFGLK